MAVKGSKFKPMRVIPHSPGRQLIGYGALALAFLLGLPAAYFAGLYEGNQGQKAIEDRLSQQNQELVNGLNQELTLLRTNADVDRQTMEDLRQLVMTQRAQISASERDLRVYKELLSPSGKGNPLGISFGVFTVLPEKEAGHFKYSLAVQKLSAKESDFTGTLEFKIIGQEAGKTRELLLNEVAPQVTAPTIPLDFKYFQTIDGELALPAGYVPQSLALTVKGSDKKTVVETQLDWPDSSAKPK